MIPGAFAVVCLFLIESSVGFFSSCSYRYSRMNSRHTMCKDPNPTCRMFKKGVTEEDKDLILQLHNDFRSTVATGKEIQTGVMPSAADMLEMTWDDELAELAQKHAESCTYGHDCVECRALEQFMVGQNIGTRLTVTSVFVAEKDWRWFITMLYEEVSRFPKNLVRSYAMGPSDSNWQYGHFTQIVWGQTWRIGCGWTLYQEGHFNSSYYVCNYGPAGNVHHKRVYTEGAPCSACPQNSCCGETCEKFNVTSKYEGLCKIIDEQLPPGGLGTRGPDEFFSCSFYNETDCAMTIRGRDDWKLVETIGGNWITLLLNEGESTAMTMNTSFKSPSHIFCFKILIRTGSEVDNQPYGFTGDVTFLANDGKSLNFKIWRNAPRQMFTTYRLDVNLPTDVPISVSLTLTVPHGLPPQFFDIKEMSAKRDYCVWNS